jgi:hypothetical protein
VVANGFELSLQLGLLGKQALTSLVDVGPIRFELGNIDDFRDIRLRPALVIPVALRQRCFEERHLPPDFHPLVIGRSLLLRDFCGDEIGLLQ